VRSEATRGRVVTLIVASRALSEAVTFAVVATLLNAVTVGTGPVPLWTASLGVFGVTLVLASILRERGTMRQSAGLAVIVIGASVAWGLTLDARSPDALAVLTRIVGFGIAGEAYLWRTLGIARGLQRWREVRNGALLALGTIVVASLMPGPVDRSALPALALAVAVVGAVALSLARASEELALTAGQVRGRPATSSATGTAFALGLLAIVAAITLPAAQALLAEAARAAGPALGQILFVLLLPLGYVAAYLVYFALWIRELLRPTGVELRLPPSPFAPGDDQERLREAEEIRPYVFGAIEILIAIVALGFAVALVARLVQERRALLPEGASLERERVDGIGLGATLSALLPRRSPRRGPPADDGTPAAAIRRMYWRLLELAERGGPGWREPAETPAEHEARLVGSADRWRAAAPIVRAFEELRYGEREPDERTVTDARAALRRVEAAR
jgi:hypothetical protein